MDALSLYGMRVIVSPLLPMQVPNKVLPPKPWHKHDRGYATRIGKKLRKRFGTHLVEMLMMQATGQVLLSAERFRQVQAATKDTTR